MIRKNNYIFEYITSNMIDPFYLPTLRNNYKTLQKIFFFRLLFEAHREELFNSLFGKCFCDQFFADSDHCVGM
jgi:hypothetical protein